MRESSERSDLLVVGGGLAGLAAAALAARGGRSVLVLEKGAEPGGLARTRQRQGYYFNLGPRALFGAGHGQRVLRDLGVQWRGHAPPPSGLVEWRGGLHALPASLSSLMRTGLFDWRDKLQFGYWFQKLGTLNAAEYDRLAIDEWIRAQRLRPRVAALLTALLRLGTYANAPDRASAGAALAQLQLALRGNVEYLDGGWQTLVDGLRQAAQSNGARIESGARVERVVDRGAAAALVRLADGRQIEADAVILACGLEASAALVDGPAADALAQARSRAMPARAATLDVGLSRLPRGENTFALGLDEAWYYSAHTSVARLAPSGGALLHLLHYLPCGEREHDPAASERLLTGVLDRLQPGWREVLVERQFLPSMLVTHDAAQAAHGGLAGRTGPALAGSSRLFVAGDWVGQRGLLADAALASAEEAAGLALRAPAVGERERNTRGAVHVH